MNRINEKKLIQALNFFAFKEGGAISKIKAYKLLWLADRYHLRKYGRMITNDGYYAMPKGIVPTEAKHIMDGIPNLKCGNYIKEYLEISDSALSYASSKEPNMRVFSKTDTDALNVIWANYGSMDASHLSAMSHRFPEWKRYKTLIKDPKELSSYCVCIDDFFVNYEDKTCLFVDDTELLELTKELYKSEAV